MLLASLLCALQAPMPAPQAAPSAGLPPGEEPAVVAPDVEPYAGPLDQGLAELARASESGAHDRALELAAALLASPRLGELSEARRARLLHDTGLARARAGLVEPGVVDLRASAALAGPGELRATSLFEAGAVRLLRAEELRLQVPEVARRLGVPQPPVPPIAPGLGDAPDPLALAREAYLGARAGLLERLRLDWRDADTRADLELVSRRLRELDDVEREREEQQQQDQQQDQQQQDQQPQDQQQEPGEQDQPPDERESPPEDAQGEQQPGEEQPEQPPEPEPGEEQPRQEQQAAPEEERVLSREEVQRLLDQLQEIEEQARAVRAMLRERRRVPVEKDW